MKRLGHRDPTVCQRIGKFTLIALAVIASATALSFACGIAYFGMRLIWLFATN